MPAVSKAQREAMAIVEHHPSQLNKANRGMLKMSHSQLHDFASTSESHMPTHVTQVRQHLNTKHIEGRLSSKRPPQKTARQVLGHKG